MLSILGEHDPYEFHSGFELDVRLKDILESNVDEKYYLSKEIQDRFKPNDKFKDMSGNIVGTTAPDFRTIGQRDLCYQENSIMGTLVATDYKQPKQVVLQTSDNSNKPYFVDRQGRVQEFDLKENYIQWDTSKKQYNSQQDRVFYDEKLSGTIATNAMANVIENSEPLICASRGRNPENPSDRTAGIKLEQRLEINYSGTSNTITTVQKDNYVLEPNVLRPERTEYGKAVRKQYEKGEINEKIGNMREYNPRTDGITNTLTTVQKDNYLFEPQTSKDTCKVIDCGHIPYETNTEKKHQSNTVYSENGLNPTLNATDYKNPTKIISYDNYRIRKLTPKECWRLMGIDDECFDKAQQVNSNSQLYKQAGNGIVINVLYYIFKELFKDNIIE